MKVAIPCNFCELQRIRREARQTGRRVTLLASSLGGGIDVYVHPKSISIRHLDPDENGPRKEFRKAWFMELTDKCCC